MKNEFFQIQQILKRRSLRGYATRHNYHGMAHAFWRRIKTRYPSLRLGQLKLRHIKEDIEQLQQDGIAIGQVKNYAIIYRIIAEGIDKKGMVPDSNQELGIGKRASHATANRAVALSEEQIERLYARNVLYGLAAEGAMYLGLRAQEVSKFDPHAADRGGYAKLKGTWCKGGRERVVDLTPEGRKWLDKAKSIIPPGKSISDRPIENFYRCFLSALKEIANATPHSLRYHRAHEIYRERTALEPPIAGGPKMGQITREKREIVRLTCDYISEEFGHNRRWVASHYLGKFR